jgi:hypothetical protein
MDDHRRVAFSVFGHSHFFNPLPPGLKRMNGCLIILRNIIILDYFRWLGLEGGEGQLGAEGERQQAFRLAAPNHRVVARSGGAVARLSVRDVLVMAPFLQRIMIVI